MKFLNKFLKIYVIGIIISNICYSEVTPTYSLTAKNFNYVAPNILEFGIYLKNTSPDPNANFLEYSMGQFIFNFDPAFANYGTLTYEKSPITIPPPSDLTPAYLIPGLPVIYENQLRIKTIVPYGPGSGPHISSTGDGTLIVRMRLTTTAAFFRGSPNLTWRNSADGGFYTKLIAYTYPNTGGPGVNITNPANHIVENLTNKVTVFPNENSYINLYYAISAIGNGFHGNGNIDVHINEDIVEAGTVYIYDTGVNPQKITITPTANVKISKTDPSGDLIAVTADFTEIVIDGRIGGTGNTRSLKLIGNYHTDINEYGCINIGYVKNFTAQYVEFETESNYAIRLWGGFHPDIITNINNNVFKIIPKAYITTYSQKAIYLSHPGGVYNISNNFIYNTEIISPITANLTGIYVTKDNIIGNSYIIINLNYNTVHFQGDNLNGYSVCAYFEYNGFTYIEKNNVFINNITTGDCFAKSVKIITSVTNVTEDYNCYFTSNTGSTSGVVNINNTISSTNIKYVNLGLYQCAVSPNEQNSKFENVNFVVNSPNLTGTSLGNYDLVGTPLPAPFNIDIYNTPRNASTPYKGAFEATTAFVIPANNVTVNPGGRSFTDLKSAFDEINNNLCGRYTAANVIVTVNASTTETATAVLNDVLFLTCTVKPAAVVTVTGAVSPLIELNGASNVTFDGLIGSTKSFTISGTGDCIKMKNGASNNKLKDIISSSSGITTDVSNIYIAGTDDILPATGNNDNIIENCIIDGGYKGIHIIGSPVIYYGSKINTGTVIKNNEISNFKYYGILASYNTKSNIIEGNKVTLGSALFTAGDIYLYGIGCSGIGSNYITKNKILSTANPVNNTYYFGMAVNAVHTQQTDNSTTNFITNNFISITNDAAGYIYGIYYNYSSSGAFGTVVQTINFVHNTVYIGKSGSSTSGFSVDLGMYNLHAAGSVYNVYNNLLINERNVLSNSQNQWALEIQPNSASTLNADYNCYWSSKNIALFNGASYYNIDKYQCAFYPNEQNSNFKQVSLASPLTLPDIAAASVNDYDIIGKKDLIPPVTSDINGSIRNSDHPYMGAKEETAFNFTNPVVKIRAYLQSAPPPRNEPVTIELRANTGPLYSLITSPFSVNLNTSGTVSLICTGVIFPSSFYIVIKHKNSLETWSKSGGEILTGNYLSYDFSSSADQAFCSDASNCNLLQCGCKFYIPAGDVNQDGFIDLADKSRVGDDVKSPGNGTLACPGTSFIQAGPGISTLVPPLSTDLNSDGAVDCNDLCIAQQNTESGFTLNSPIILASGIACEFWGNTICICP